MIRATKTIPAVEAKDQEIEIERIEILLRDKTVWFRSFLGGCCVREISDKTLELLENTFVAELEKDATLKNVSTISEIIKE